MPLFVGIASQERAEKMNELARNSQKFYPGMPTITYDSPAFSTDYWRGQTWLNVAFFAVKGLRDYGYTDTASRIKEYLLDMVYDELPKGLFENYDSVNRRGMFNKAFSWSAAFVIEFVLMK
jgi:putative isomerase